MPIIASVAIVITHGPRPGLIIGTGFAAAYAGWAWLDPRSFRAWVVEPVRRRWLTWSRYTRTWESVCTLHGLTARLGERARCRVAVGRIGKHDRLLDVRVVAGHSLTDWHKRSEA